MYWIPVVISLLATLLTMPLRFEHLVAWTMSVIVVGFANWVADAVYNTGSWMRPAYYLFFIGIVWFLVHRQLFIGSIRDLMTP